jgi:hypothetical protein
MIAGHRLFQVIHRAAFQGLHRLFRAAQARGDQHRPRQVHLAQNRRQVEAADPGHARIGNDADGLGSVLLHVLQKAQAAAKGEAGKTNGLNEPLQ